MSAYTLKNLLDVKDSAPEFGIGPGYEARFPLEDLGCETTGFSHQVMAPKSRAPFAHVHEKAEEVYVIIGGSGEMLLDGEMVPVRRLDAIRVAPGVVRSFASGDEGRELLVFGPRHEGDGKMSEPTWPT